MSKFVFFNKLIMTTITIQNGLNNEDIFVKTPQEALQTLLDSLGYTYMMPVNDEETLARLKIHFKENEDRSLDDYDNI